MPRPNFVCVSVDSLRPDFCSFVAESEATTPFLRSIASQSTVYRGAIAPSIWTLPSHASIFTGLFPPEHGLLTGTETLGAHPTFAELLAAEGYETVAFQDNAWLDTGEMLRGFDQPERGAPSAGDDGTSWGWKRRFADAVGTLTPRGEASLRSAHEISQRFREGTSAYAEWKGYVSSRGDKTTRDRRLTDRAIESIDGTDTPFCWFLHLNGAHWKFRPPDPYYRRFTNRRAAPLAYNYGWWQDRVYGSRTNRLETTVGDVDPPATEVDTFRNLYRGCIRNCDELIRDLVAALEEAGVWSETVLVVFGDHGEGFGEDGVFGHHFSVDDSLIRVPLLIRDPMDRLPSGTVTSPVSLVDVYPTLLNLAGAEGPETNAVDLVEATRDYAYTYYDISDHDYYTGASGRGIDPKRLPPPRQYAIWGSEHEKGVYYPETDTFSVTGTGGDSLRSRLESHTAGLARIETGRDAISAGVRRRLEEMGYLRE